MNNVELLVRGVPLKPEEIIVSRPPAAQEAMQAVLKRAKAIVAVTSPKSQATASLVAQELQGLRKGLKDQYDLAKRPIINTGTALDTIYKELDTPLKDAYGVVSGMVASYQDGLRLEEERIAAEAKAAEDRKQKEHEAEIKRLEAEKAAELARAKAATDGRDRAGAERKIERISQEIESEQVAMVMEKENLPLAEVPVPRAKPQGGRTYYDYQVEITDQKALFAARPELLKVELKVGAAKEAAKYLDQTGAPLNTIPGLSIKRIPKAAFKAASVIRAND
jgi:hypothetical protein